MRSVIGVLIVLAIGCKQEATTTAGGSAGGSAAPPGSAAPAIPAGSGAGVLATVALPDIAATGGLGVPGAPKPAAVSDAARSACQAACDHRKSCGLEPGACVEECGALHDLKVLGDADLKTYAGAACDQVKAAEPQFRVATACRQACARRAECVTGASVKECIPDCGALVIASKQDPSVLGEYIKKDCAGIKEEEPTLICLHTCTHVLGCGVAGDLPICLKYCGERLQEGMSLETVANVSKASCEDVKKSIQLPQPAAPGGGAKLCTAEGIYTVCDGAYCRDRQAIMMGAGPDEASAGNSAVAKCTTHMLQAIAIASINDRASVKHSCRVTRC